MVNKKVIWITAGIILIIIVFLIFSHFSNDSRNLYKKEASQLKNNSNQAEMNFFQNTYQNTENCINPVFTAYFVDPKKVQKVGQVGVVHGSGLYIVERSYVSVKDEFLDQKVPVYSPVDMTLRAGSHYQDFGGSGNNLPDYALWFDADCNVEINLAHLKEVVESISSQLPDVKTDSRSTQLKPIKFKAGDLIGYFIYKKEGVSGFDFIVRDKKIVNQFINQERYSDGRAENLINGVCPYDYYEPSKKEEYYNLLGGAGGNLFKVKDCGNSSRDVKGTISGMWFLDKVPKGWIYDSYKDGDYGSTLSIVGDEESITIGNLGQSKLSRIYSSNPTYKLPQEITNQHCYQFDGFAQGESSGWAYLKVISDTELDVVFSQTGKCPVSFPSNPKRYYK